MLYYIWIFIIKVLDNILATTLTIFIQTNKSILSGMIVTISNIIFYKLIQEVNTNGDFIIYLIAISSGLGTYLAIKINKKLINKTKKKKH